MCVWGQAGLWEQRPVCCSLGQNGGRIRELAAEEGEAIAEKAGLSTEQHERIHPILTEKIA